MPRAKRTDRAAARRRYRASTGAPTSDEAGAADAPAVPEREPAQRSAATPERPSISYAFRAAFRPVTLGDDLRTFPSLLTHRAVWLPILLTVGAGLAFLVTDGGNWLVAIVATYFVAPPALGSVFIGGFLAPRSSYLIGLLVGLVAAAVASAIILSTTTPLGPTGNGSAAASPSPSIVASASASPAASGSSAASASPAGSASPGASPPAAASPTPAASPSPSPTPAPVQDQIIYAFVTSPPFGMFFAASAAWYRRFLRLSNPNRGRPQQRRGSDGRSRSNPNQKPRR